MSEAEYVAALLTLYADFTLASQPSRPSTRAKTVRRGGATDADRVRHCARHPASPELRPPAFRRFLGCVPSPTSCRSSKS